MQGAIASASEAGFLLGGRIMSSPLEAHPLTAAMTMGRPDAVGSAPTGLVLRELLVGRP